MPSVQKRTVLTALFMPLLFLVLLAQPTKACDDCASVQAELFGAETSSVPENPVQARSLAADVLECAVGSGERAPLATRLMTTVLVGLLAGAVLAVQRPCSSALFIAM